MTTAEQIAQRLGNDGGVFEVAPREGEQADPRAREEGNVTLDSLARQAGADVERRDGMVRYGFADGSAIVDAGSAWDLAFPGCWCWTGGGHTPACRGEEE